MLLILFILLLLFLQYLLADNDLYYVSNNLGQDNINCGLNETNACKSINYLVSNYIHNNITKSAIIYIDSNSSLYTDSNITLSDVSQSITFRSNNLNKVN